MDGLRCWVSSVVEDDGGHSGSHCFGCRRQLVVRRINEADLARTPRMG